MHNANSERLSERLSTQSIRVLNRMYLERNIYIYILIVYFKPLAVVLKLNYKPVQAFK